MEMGKTGLTVGGTDRGPPMSVPPVPSRISVQCPTPSKRVPILNRRHQAHTLSHLAIAPPIEERSEEDIVQSSRSTGSHDHDVTNPAFAPRGSVLFEKRQTLNPYYPIPVIQRSNGQSVPATTTTTTTATTTTTSQKPPWPTTRSLPLGLISSASRAEVESLHSYRTHAQKQPFPVIKHLRRLMNGAPPIYKTSVPTTKQYAQESKFFQASPRTKKPADQSVTSSIGCSSTACSSTVMDAPPGGVVPCTHSGYFRHPITSMTLALPRISSVVHRKRRRRGRGPNIPNNVVRVTTNIYFIYGSNVVSNQW